MNILKNLLHAIEITRFHLAIFAGLICLGIQFLLFNSFDLSTPVLSMLLCLFIYSINRFTDPEEDKINCSEEYIWIMQRRYAVYLLGIFVPVCGIFYLFFSSNLNAKIAIVALTIAGILYSANPFGPNLKRYLWIKALLPAFVWTFTTTFLPSIVLGESVNFEQIILASYVFSIIFEMEILFDMRDLKGDVAAGLKTFAAITSQHQKQLLVISLTFFAFLYLSVAFFTSSLPGYLYAPILCHRMIVGLIEFNFTKLTSEKLRTQIRWLLSFHGCYLIIQILLIWKLRTN